MAGSVQGEVVTLDEILKGVSRSFYLTLRWLPAGMREPVSIAYLLARASDTIADTETVSVQQRADLLGKYQSALSAGELDQLDISEFVVDVPDAREVVLMQRLGDIQTALEALGKDQQRAIQWVLEIIIKGQMWDLTFFPQGQLTTVETEAELLHYTYSVAGCVGEFWTKVGFLDSDEYATESYEQMMTWGRHYGQALQLINILRDTEKDHELGRVYLKPEDRKRMLRQARTWLDEGMKYCRNLPRWRLRMPTVLPAVIGHKTLDLIESADKNGSTCAVKVTRNTVYMCLIKSALFR